MNKFLIFVLAVATAGCSSDEPTVDTGDTAADRVSAIAEPGRSAAEQASQLITDDFIREIVAEISDDRYEGREPASAGDQAARQYLAGRMVELGLEPGAADGGWEQPFDIVGVTADQPDSWTFTRGDSALTLGQWDDYVVQSGVQEERVDITDAEVVFVGYGIEAPEYDWNDFKDADLSGKILLVMNNDPDWHPDLFEGEKRLWYGRWDYKYLSAAEHGAAAAIIIHTASSAGYPFQVIQTSWTGTRYELPAKQNPRGRINGWVTESAARNLIALAGMDLDQLREAAYDRDFRPVPLGIRTSIGMDVKIEAAQTANILGLLPGSDPDLRDEVVIYTAHHDHLGIGPADATGDTIYNGARDNALGVAQIIALARAFQALPEKPRRSILFGLVGAEEQGLLGSAWYAANPTFGPANIAANINYDTGNIWGKTHDITFVGLGKSSIDDVLRRFAAEQGRVVKPDQHPDQGLFYRSDQFNFAKIGVPAMYLDESVDFVGRPTGWGRQRLEEYTNMHYHQPSDEYDSTWNLEGLIQDALLGFWTGLAIANADDMPIWSAGDEFEAVRLEALSKETN